MRVFTRRFIASIVTVGEKMKRRVKTLISGLRIQEAVQYDAPKAAEKGKKQGKKKENKPIDYAWPSVVAVASPGSGPAEGLFSFFLPLFFSV